MSELNDIVAVGLDLKPKTLLQAYSQGVFPWPTPGLPLLWYSPQIRAVLSFKHLHVSRRLKQYLKKANFTYTINRDFASVIEACSQRGDEGTWITDEMKQAYIAFHKAGHAHSVEVWENEKLVGGLYGVDVAGTFAGESMFHTVDHASKAAVLFVTSLLKRAGREFMDIQVMSDHMAAFGAENIARSEFKKRLSGVQSALKRFGPTEPFSERETFRYCDFSTIIE